MRDEWTEEKDAFEKKRNEAEQEKGRAEGGAR
jgi:hypothetical protein